MTRSAISTALVLVVLNACAAVLGAAAWDRPTRSAASAAWNRPTSTASWDRPGGAITWERPSSAITWE